MALQNSTLQLNSGTSLVFDQAEGTNAFTFGISLALKTSPYRTTPAPRPQLR